MISDDGVVFGLLAIIVASVVGLSKSEHRGVQKFFKVFPSILLVYLLPALLVSFGIVDASTSKVYQFNIDYLLPSCLILLTLSLDLPALKKLGPKCLAIFFAGTLGIIFGGPFAVLLVKAFSADALPKDAWRVLGTLAGSWIGGGVNQASMKEAFQVGDTIFATSVAVDIFVGSFFWMSTLLFLSSKNDLINKWLKADQKLLDQLNLQNVSQIDEVASFKDYCWIFAVGFGGTSLCRFLADPIVKLIKAHAPYLEAYNLTSVFFWVVIFASLIGVFISLTKLRYLESKGASKLGTVFLYMLVASIGMKIDLGNVWSSPVYFLVGIIWIVFHGAVILFVTKLLKAPLFFMAVGSQANIGAAASAPIVAGVFAPHLAPVGVILAILGYVIGNYGALMSAMMMKWILCG